MKKLIATHIKTIDPTSTDNVAAGFGIGQNWINTVTGDKFYYKNDAINAVWINVSISVVNLDYLPSPTDGTITNSNGTPAIIPLADATNAGLLSPADLAKISTAIQTILPGTNIAVNNTDPVNPIITAIPSTSAGVFDRVYFTGQVATVATPIGPNYDTIRNGKGSVSLVSIVASGLTASTKVYIPNNMIGPAQLITGTLPLGNYTAFLSVEASAAVGLKRFTIEVFHCDNAGVILPATGPISGSSNPFYAGKNTVVILDSGDVNLGNDVVTQIGLTGYITAPVVLLAGERFRYHISVARGAGGGGTQTMTVYTGSNANSYVEAPVPISTTTVINLSIVPGATGTDALNALNTLISNRTLWKGNWIAGTYQKNDQVLDNSFLAIANKVTEDRPAPQPVGQPGYIYAAPTISTTSISAKQVIFGNRYNFQKDVILQGWRVNVVAGNNYSIYLVQDPLGTAIISQIINYTSQRSGWITLNVPKTIIQKGNTYDLVATVSQPATVPVITSANYDYKKPTNFGTINTGEIVQANNSTNTLRIHKTDFNAIDRTAMLTALVIGDIITCEGTRWAIQTKTDSGTHFTFVVSPATQIAGNGLKTFQFETVSSTPITYPLNTNYWSTSPPVGIVAQGLLAINATYFSIVPNTTAYGTDILIQDIIPSADWDIQAFSQTSVGGDTTPTDLGYTESSTNGVITNTNGTSATVPLATSINAGLLSPVDFTKLGTVVTTTGAQTLTDKAITKRVVNFSATSGIITPNVDTTDILKTPSAYLSGNVSFNAPTGTKTNGQMFMIMLRDNGVGARTLTFDTNSNGYIGTVDFSLPSITILGKWKRLLFQWNGDISFWELISSVNSL